MIKGMTVFSSDCLGLSSLLQLLTWKHVLDYCNIWKIKDGTLLIDSLASKNSFSSETSSKMAWTLCKKIVDAFLTKKGNFLSHSDHPIMFKFC